MIYLNGSQINTTFFPDNTSQVWKLSERLLSEDLCTVHWEYQSEGEFLQLAQLKALLDSYKKVVSLIITYLPYGRQDKKVSNDSTFALVPFTNLLNYLNFSSVTIVDPHSNIAIDLIIGAIAQYPVSKVFNAAALTDTTLLCFPDKGAVTKYSGVYNFLDYIYGDKVRDQATGYITKYNLIGVPTWQNVLIVDDICDGGATFKLLAKELIFYGASNVNLFVTHGIFSNGLATLKESGIERIFTNKGEVVESSGSIVYRHNG